MSVVVSAFYKFVRIEDAPSLRDRLYDALARREMRGTILLAPEGINGTISGAPSAMSSLLEELRADPRFADLETKDAQAPCHPFQRIKVKLKREIISLRAPEADPTRLVGVYVEPEDWNALISDPDVLVIDTRNVYEVAAGTFARAVDPGLSSFGDWTDYAARELAEHKTRRIAMFCTGGIRCEKASAHLLAHGFSDVFHLKGGILNYLARMPEDRSLWRGRCYVFDEREAVTSADFDPRPREQTGQ